MRLNVNSDAYYPDYLYPRKWDTPIDELNLSMMTQEILLRNGIGVVEQFPKITELELLGLDGLSFNRAEETKQALKVRGVSLKEELPDFPIEDLGLSQQIVYSLKSNGFYNVNTFKRLIAMTERDIRNITQMPNNRIQAIKSSLAARDHSLKQEEQDWTMESLHLNKCYIRRLRNDGLSTYIETAKQVAQLGEYRLIDYYINEYDMPELRARFKAMGIQLDKYPPAYGNEHSDGSLEALGLSKDYISLFVARLHVTKADNLCYFTEDEIQSTTTFGRKRELEEIKSALARNNIRLRERTAVYPDDSISKLEMPKRIERALRNGPHHIETVGQLTEISPGELANDAGMHVRWWISDIKRALRYVGMELHELKDVGMLDHDELKECVTLPYRARSVLDMYLTDLYGLYDKDHRYRCWGLEHLSTVTEEELIEESNVGTSSLEQIKSTLEKREMSLRSRYRNGSLAALDLPNRLIAAIKRCYYFGIETVEQLAGLTEVEVMGIDGIGRKNLDLVKSALESVGLQLRQER